MKDGKLQSYRELVVWQKGMEIAERRYRLTRSFPRDELFGLTSQIRRASSSVPANIAEGYGRGLRKEYVQFLRIARGSLKEVETHLLLAVRVELLNTAAATEVLTLCDEVGRMLGTMIRSLTQAQVQDSSPRL